MTTKLTLMALAAVLSLAACGDAEVAEPQEQQAPPPEAARDTRVTDAVNEPLDQAKAVEDLVLQRKADMDARLEALEDDTQTDDAP